MFLVTIQLSIINIKSLNLYDFIFHVFIKFFKLTLDDHVFIMLQILNFIDLNSLN